MQSEELEVVDEEGADQQEQPPQMSRGHPVERAAQRSPAGAIYFHVQGRHEWVAEARHLRGDIAAAVLQAPRIARVRCDLQV
jgi:hypothetical protein